VEGVILKEFEQKLKQYLLDNNLDAEQYIFDVPCHSAEEAVAALNASIEDIVKSICMIDSSGNLIVSIVRGEDRASTSRVAKALNIESPLIANPDEVLEKTGYPCGGVPAFGYKAIFLIDPKVMEREFVYTGGGSPYSLTKISTKILQQISNGQVVRVRK
jgi:Cys-tRNA(Pro)/Cys-tRNA(Cys) deacylase